eukprot:4467029-Pyramimonas_sp.AAC.1
MIRKARGLTLMNDNASMKDWRILNGRMWDYWAKAFPCLCETKTLLQRPQRHGGLECKRHCVC